jgi:hypothetical protein
VREQHRSSHQPVAYLDIMSASITATVYGQHAEVALLRQALSLALLGPPVLPFDFCTPESVAHRLLV